MPYYNVKGRFVGEVLDRNGETADQRSGTINHNIFSSGPEFAADIALRIVAYHEHACDDYWWQSEPEVTELPEDQAMRAAGYASLPGLERSE